MKKNLLNFFVLTCFITSFTTSVAFADVNQNALIQKQQQSDLYAQQVDYLRQQAEYLRQQNEILKQQNQALQQSQAYSQGYYAGQQQPHYYYHSNFYAPGLFVGGMTAGYLLGHFPMHHYCHRCW